MGAPMHEAHVRNRYEMAIAIAAKLQAEGVASADARGRIAAMGIIGASLEMVSIVVHILRTNEAARNLREVARG